MCTIRTRLRGGHAATITAIRITGTRRRIIRTATRPGLIWRHPKVSLTPHASGITGGQDVRNQALFLDNLARFLADAPLLHEIDAKDVLAG